jgi:(R,R)-butanediol dehydrogenase/meso-butanediol dehydrogenase/diacetyl reductase
MKAAVFRGIGRPLQIEEVPLPELRPGELLLRTRYCGVCGSDLHATQAGTLVVPEGTVLGHEFAGEVVDSRSPDWKAGDLVTAFPALLCTSCTGRGLSDCAEGNLALCQRKGAIGFTPQLPGGLGEFVRVSASAALRLPAGVGAQHGATIEPLAVGLHAVKRGQVTLGDNVLVIGAGPVGLAVTAFARAAGAREVIVSEYAQIRRSSAAKFGASQCIDPAVEDVKEAFVRHAGAPPDVVFECVGVPGMIKRCISFVKFGGRVVVVGVCMLEDTFKPLSAISKEISLIFAYAYERRDWPVVLDFLHRGKIDPSHMITDVVSLDALPAAFEALRKPSSQIKLLVQHAS